MTIDPHGARAVLRPDDRFKVLADNGKVRQMTSVDDLSDLMAHLHMMKVGLRDADGGRPGLHGARYAVRTQAGGPLPAAVEAAIDRAIANGYVDPRNAWPDRLEPPQRPAGHGARFEATLVSYQPVRTFRRTFTGLDFDTALEFLERCDVKPRTTRKERESATWKMRERSIRAGGLTCVELRGEGGRTLDAAELDRIDDAIAAGFRSGAAAPAAAVTAPSQDRNEKLLAWLERGNQSGSLEGPQLRDADTWLLHFSEEAPLIAQNGFRRGTPRMADLGFSHGSHSDRPGYNYAFEADDEFSIRTAVEYDTFGGAKDRAVLFQSGGVACHFVTDDFNQVIFWGAAAKTPLVLLTADHEADENRGLEPHDWSWTIHLPDGSMETLPDLFSAIGRVREAMDPATPSP
ncbi:hypothetical protein LAZ40_03170 [Cereibacter sphaeroides]|uniref:hypothetical protein n=1 Tax=Cereibacter sphaeroides TaxID=1063 RepID=UPI001F31AE45|nr:hypothetical protein [Cereibacter sphaeroides]MCE6958056.1 hypothetical protein [Cereibacter sphaeroides]MCE6971351.1 hypothetical protein [Cereibacter sphaeroides]